MTAAKRGPVAGATAVRGIRADLPAAEPALPLRVTKAAAARLPLYGHAGQERPPAPSGSVDGPSICFPSAGGTDVTRRVAREGDARAPGPAAAAEASSPVGSGRDGVAGASRGPAGRPAAPALVVPRRLGAAGVARRGPPARAGAVPGLVRAERGRERGEQGAAGRVPAARHRLALPRPGPGGAAAPPPARLARPRRRPRPAAAPRIPAPHPPARLRQVPRLRQRPRLPLARARLLRTHR